MTTTDLPARISAARAATKGPGAGDHGVNVTPLRVASRPGNRRPESGAFPSFHPAATQPAPPWRPGHSPNTEGANRCPR